MQAPAYAENICISEQDAVDLITLLDASERDMDRLSTCTALVDKLYKVLKEKDEKIESLTQELIDARQDVLKYRAQNKRLRRITWYALGAAAVVILVEIVPVFL
jgi:hypothetical protein